MFRWVIQIIRRKLKPVLPLLRWEQSERTSEGVRTGGDLRTVFAQSVRPDAIAASAARACRRVLQKSGIHFVAERKPLRQGLAVGDDDPHRGNAAAGMCRRRPVGRGDKRRSTRSAGTAHRATGRDLRGSRLQRDQPSRAYTHSGIAHSVERQI